MTDQTTPSAAPIDRPLPGLPPGRPGLGAVHLAVTDRERALAFWRDVLGLELLDPDAYELRMGAGGRELVLHAVVLRAHRDRLHIDAMLQVLEAAAGGGCVVHVLVMPIGAPPRWGAVAAGPGDDAADLVLGDHAGVVGDVHLVGCPVQVRAGDMRARAQRPLDRLALRIEDSRLGPHQHASAHRLQAAPVRSSQFENGSPVMRS